MKKVIILLRRKPGLSHEQFKAYYEANHAPMAVRLFPSFGDYRRNFIDAAAYRERHGEDPEFDVVTEITFHTDADYDAFRATAQRPEVAAEVQADEERFIDRTRMVSFVCTQAVSQLPATA
jgi:uncharacterized protein (TIGR02118 family)